MERQQTVSEALLELAGEAREQRERAEIAEQRLRELEPQLHEQRSRADWFAGAQGEIVRLARRLAEMEEAQQAAMLGFRSSDRRANELEAQLRSQVASNEQLGRSLRELTAALQAITGRALRAIDAAGV